MLRYLLRIFVWDETAGAALLRAFLIGLGTAVASGALDVTKIGLPPAIAPWLGIAAAAAGGFITSTRAKKLHDEKNGTPPALSLGPPSSPDSRSCSAISPDGEDTGRMSGARS